MTGTVLFVFAERAVPAASVGFRGRLIYPEICVVLHSQLSSAHLPRHTWATSQQSAGGNCTISRIYQKQNCGFS